MTDDRQQTAIIDTDEYGKPVDEQYRRLGAGSSSCDDEGMYVRFEPGFGLDVHIGHRQKRYEGGQAVRPTIVEDHEWCRMAIGGWAALCDLVDEWRARQASPSASATPSEETP